ncbi:DsbA family protein [Roseovarius sp. S1116L3]|uniref:DsbA family protein n=1 Tax=Roseovarius roseus TaxID=3342636 RepID=UPI0037281A77
MVLKTKFNASSVLSRRIVLVGAGLGGMAALLYSPGVRRLIEAPFNFKPVTGLEGFRRLNGGDVTSANFATIGLDSSETTGISPALVCQNLFLEKPQAGQVPVAYFSDSRCAYCRVLSPLLHELQQTEPIAITWHELPLFGQTSQRAAMAAQAAQRQGAYWTFHDRLMGTPFVANDAYLRQLALDAGIDADKLLRDMTSAEVTNQIEMSKALAGAFGFVGTPAMVIGRTAILGVVDERTIRRLVQDELNATEPGPCA